MKQGRATTAALADRAYSVLRDLIIRGRLAPGARASEVELATRLSISRTPIREALGRLAHDGFLHAPTDSQRRRFVVAPLTVDDVRDLYAIMGALEGAAGRNVVRLSSGERRTLSRRLSMVNARFEAVAGQRSIDLDRIFDAHNAFHHTFVNACGTPRLRRLIEQVRPQVDRYEFIYAPHVGPLYDDTFDEHRAIIRALRDGSAVAAEAAIRANWTNGGSRLEAAIERVGPRGDYDEAFTAKMH